MTRESFQFHIMLPGAVPCPSKYIMLNVLYLHMRNTGRTNIETAFRKTFKSRKKDISVLHSRVEKQPCDKVLCITRACDTGFP